MTLMLCVEPEIDTIQFRVHWVNQMYPRFLYMMRHGMGNK